MRFYLDEDISEVVARVARHRFGLDVTTTREVGMDHATDEEQLLYAAREGRCVVTRNGDDFVVLTRQFVESELPHSGAVIVPNSFLGNEYFLIARGLAALHAFYPEDTVPYLVVYLPAQPPDVPAR